MRKILSFLMMTLFAGSLLAAPYTLTFTYFDKTDGDGNAKLTTVDAIFSQESQAYVASVETGTQVYAGRKYEKDGNYILSNLKLGSSSAAGELKFTLNTASEMDSIVFNAAMYSSTEGGDGFSVNGTQFTLSAGKLAFERCVLKPTGTVSTIDIVQTKASKGRFFLTSIEVYPKEAAGGEDPAPTTRTLYCKVAQSWWKADGAAVGIYAYKGGEYNAAWPGERMTLAENETDVWTATIDAKYENVIFVRVNASGDIADWGAKTADLTLADAGENDLYTVTSSEPVWGNPGVTGTWSKYSPSESPAQPKYFLKNNWDGADTWTWKEMTYYEDEYGAYYYLTQVVFGGTGVNLNTTDIDAGSKWIAAKDIETYDLSLEPATLGALDTVFISFDPQAVNQYTGANGLSATILGKYVNPTPQPELADGFYLIGKIGGVAGWAITDLKAEQMFAQNQENPGEYMLNVTLAEGDELKVVNVLNNEIATWYPGDDNFIVTAAYAGEKTVYFRPDKQGGEGWHHGCIYIAPNPATGISNNAVEGKAVKMIMDAQLLIIRNGKTYNVQGQQLK